MSEQNGQMSTLNLDLGVLKTKNFSLAYPELVREMVNNGSFESSRNGDTIEILNFKTILTNPRRNLVYGNGRNINIFFLFAEAVWIWLGRSDVKFLKFLNSQMGEYTDDGENFHAPYGFRLRHYNTATSNVEVHNKCGVEIDQIELGLRMLQENLQNRKTVMSIWNPNLDLDTKTLDTPCNDMLMFKVRDSELHTTIQNRSNDVHWGLPTNIFQFSFVSQVMAKILGIDVGTQVHNSQSLHLYLSNPLTLKLMNKASKEGAEVCYDSAPFDGLEGMSLQEVDQIFTEDVQRIETLMEGGENFDFQHLSSKDSVYLTNMFIGLAIYVDYCNSGRKETDRIKALSRLDLNISGSFKIYIEYKLMVNFFTTRLKEEYNESKFKKLDL